MTEVRSLQIFSKQWPPSRETVDFHFDVSFDQIFAEQNGSRVSTRYPLIDSLFRSLPPFIIARLPPTFINRRRDVQRCIFLIFIRPRLFIRP